jgi:Domain of unknown function (DUF4258)
MAAPDNFIALVRKAGKKKLLFLPHAVNQMIRPERMITSAEIRAIVEKGEIIEDYPEDQRGHSCLILGFGTEGRPIHVVCSPKNDYLAIITAYLPSADEWNENFRERVKR